MRGPFERLKYDLRRLWECPLCKRRERTAGTVTFRHCSCQMNKADGKLVIMKLVEDGVQWLVPTVKIEHELSHQATAIADATIEAVPSDRGGELGTDDATGPGTA